MKNEMDERAAWRDFYENVLPGLKGTLSRKDAQAVDTAERDYHGKRQINGKVVTLGPKRVGALLQKLAPGRYLVEHRVVFWLADKQ